MKPFETQHVSAQCHVKNHRKRINVILEILMKNGNEVVPVNSYSVLHPGSTRVQIAIRNMMSKELKLKLKTLIAKMSAANTVPNMLALKLAKKSESNSDNLIQI